MATESFIQPGREFKISEIAEELQGELEVSDEADVSGGYADVYRGTWTNPQGEKIEVAVKVFRNLIPKNQHTDREALKRKAETVGTFGDESYGYRWFRLTFLGLSAREARGFHLEQDNTPQPAPFPRIPLAATTEAH